MTQKETEKRRRERTLRFVGRFVVKHCYKHWLMTTLASVNHAPWRTLAWRCIGHDHGHEWEQMHCISIRTWTAVDPGIDAHFLCRDPCWLQPSKRLLNPFCIAWERSSGGNLQKQSPPRFHHQEPVSKLQVLSRFVSPDAALEALY